MVKSIFGSLSHGFFYFIGKILAILFIGFVVYTLVNKINSDPDSNAYIIPHNLPIYKGVIK